jgi:hypothetical protein
MTTTKQRATDWGTAYSPDQSRDRRLVHFVARHGIVSIEHVRREMAVGRTAAYRRVAACIEAGLLERLDLLRDEPSLLRATHEGISYAGLTLKVADVSPGAVGHWLRCASVGQRLERHYGPERVRTERELLFAEQLAERPLASAMMGRHPNGKPRLHRPDFSVSAATGTIAVEVELTPKAPRRLEAIVAAWQYAEWVAEVHYLCAPGQTHRAVVRAVAKSRAGKVRVFEVPR